MPYNNILQLFASEKYPAIRDCCHAIWFVYVNKFIRFNSKPRNYDFTCNVNLYGVLFRHSMSNLPVNNNNNDLRFEIELMQFLLQQFKLYQTVIVQWIHVCFLHVTASEFILWTSVFMPRDSIEVAFFVFRWCAEGNICWDL